MKIAEIYAGIEGEGIRVGIPQIFIRTQGCSLGCKTCDTVYAQSWTKKKKDLSVSDLIAALDKNPIKSKFITITGGDPLEQQDIVQVVKELSRRDYYVNIEVSGQVYNRDVFWIVDFISADLKTPSSGIEANIDSIRKILHKYDYKTQIKCVVANEKDLDFVVDTYKKLQLDKSLDLDFVITPNWTKEKDFDRTMFKKIQKRLFDEQLCIRLIAQQHKLIWGTEAREV
jgi:7-carboxy-7-deazaguanine synthase